MATSLCVADLVQLSAIFLRIFVWTASRILCSFIEARSCISRISTVVCPSGFVLRQFLQLPFDLLAHPLSKRVVVWRRSAENDLGGPIGFLLSRALQHCAGNRDLVSSVW